MSVDIKGIQKDLRAAGLDGWLFYDFRGRDPIALRLLKLPEGMRTRRWFYFIPAKGAPRKLLHKIETAALEEFAGGGFVLCGVRGVAGEFEEAARWREARCDAVFAEE